MRTCFALLCLFVSAFSFSPVFAQDSTQDLKRIEQRLNALEKSHAQPRVRLKGFIQLDTALYQLEDDYKETGLDEIESGTHFRRVRYDARGPLSGGFSYRLQLEFADEKVGYKNIHINYDLDNAQIRMGNTKVPQGHEYLTSSSDVYFIERSLATEAFNAGRQTGLEVKGHMDERFTYHAGVYTDATGSRDKEDRAVLYSGARLTGVVFESGQNLLHVGGHFLNSSSEFSPRLRTGPESRVSRIRPVDTGELEGHKVQRYGAEFMTLFSDWHFSYEYMGAKLDKPDVSFDGHIVKAAASLTGERRGYSKKSGTIKGLTPNHSWSDGGFGALEVGLRSSWVDLSDSVLSSQGVEAGKGFTLAANLVWVPVKDLVFVAEVGRFDLEDAGTVDEEKIEHYHLRAQVSF